VNPIQMAQQIKHKLQQVRWSASPSGLVFGDRGRVVVCASPPNAKQIPNGVPWCFVQLGDGTMDEQDPGLVEQRFRLAIGAEVKGDRMGEFAVIGGSTTSLGKSAGKGVGEVIERACFAVQNLTGMDGARILVSGTGTAATHPLDTVSYIAVQELMLSAWCTTAPHYASPQRLRYNVTKWEWFGEHCESRFDFYRYRLVRKQGQDPSKDPTDGTVVYSGTAPLFTGSQVSGWTYTVFAEYNARGVPEAEGTSGPEVGSYRVA